LICATSAAVYPASLLHARKHTRGSRSPRRKLKEAFAAAWIAFSGSVLAYAALFVPAVSGFIGALSFPLNRTLGVVTMIAMSLFVPYFVGYRKRLTDLTILVGFATFVSSYWLFVACWIWQKDPYRRPPSE